MVCEQVNASTDFSNGQNADSHGQSADLGMGNSSLKPAQDNVIVTVCAEIFVWEASDKRERKSISA